MENCPICNNKITTKDIKDCGYNTFNVGTITCSVCSFDIKYRCVENEETYIKLWNKDCLNIKDILNLSLENKDNFLTFLIIKKTSEITNSFEKFKLFSSKQDDIKLNLEIIEKNNLNLEINDDCEILVPKSLLDHGYETILKDLGITLQIKAI